VGVTGIGGFFFRAANPETLSAWYAEHLGVCTGEYGAWDQAAGQTLFLPFPADTDDIEAGRSFRINFRVDGLDELVAALTANGVDVATNPEWNAPGVGRFARLHDPEGNQIELWEPD
jgi:predicted enzyme related to lactoylglutathione lyase